MSRLTFLQPIILYVSSLFSMTLIILSSSIFYLIDDPLQDLAVRRNKTKQEISRDQSLRFLERSRNLRKLSKQIRNQSKKMYEITTEQDFERFSQRSSCSSCSTRSKFIDDMSFMKRSNDSIDQLQAKTAGELDYLNYKSHLDSFRPILSGENTEAIKNNCFSDLPMRRG